MDSRSHFLPQDKTPAPPGRTALGTCHAQPSSARVKRDRVRVPQELELELEETERDYDAALQRLQQYEQASRAGPSRH